ncbi:hypothetical protein BT96DRAFT_950985 [Gymnopus androsaceus JB14]|uniref:Uncharacterized protein n=1 Tax=Gymnopus androsaceus JB14 TaxID=1447944 RepID=A0A6A4GER2_9AGAR|nr:hypothetical protein BT96DRAFT_950985 [Gymnopus androsaceus JB14]
MPKIRQQHPEAIPNKSYKLSGSFAKRATTIIAIFCKSLATSSALARVSRISRREFLGWYKEYLHGGIPESRYSFGSILIQGTSFPREVLPRVICLFQTPQLVTFLGYKRLGISRLRVTSKPTVGTDDEFQPSPALSKSVNTASSSTSSRAHRRTAAVVPVIETQRASTPGQTSRLTGPGQSGLLSSTLPAGPAMEASGTHQLGE